MGPTLRFSMAELMVGTLSMGRTGPKASILIGLGVGPQWLAVESIRSHIKLVRNARMLYSLHHFAADHEPKYAKTQQNCSLRDVTAKNEKVLVD
jgi:hypothetical protein